MDVGKNRVWFDPDAQGDIAEAITVTRSANSLTRVAFRPTNPPVTHAAAPERNAKRAYGHQNGQGKRRGKKGARQNEKEEWQKKIRAQRRKLRDLRDKGELTPHSTARSTRKRAAGVP